MIKGYLYLTLFIWVSLLINSIIQKTVIKRKIKAYSKMNRVDKITKIIKTFIWSLIPGLRLMILISIYMMLTRNDEELINILNDKEELYFIDKGENEK